jgi:hypothetical protein
VDESEESPILAEWSDEEECESKVRWEEESSESDAGSCGRLAGPNHLVKGCCRGPLGGATVGARVWDGLVALTVGKNR